MAVYYQWNFAPVADINSNKDIINNRSFGSSPEEVIAKSVFFINTSTGANIVTTIKHFPGHGAVEGDSHKNLLFINGNLSELNNFHSIIEQAAPISVMMAHIAVKNNSLYNTSGLPASLSKKIVTDLLKNNLGFKGIVITDAMNMGAVNQIPNADYLAILAGNDIVIMPQNVRLLHKKLMSAYKMDAALKRQLEISIKKIIRLKICLSLIG